MTSTSLYEEADAAILAFRRAMAAIALDDPMGRGVPMAVLVDPGLHDPLAKHEDVQRAARLPLKIAAIDPSRQPYLLLLGGSLMSERCVNASLRVAVEESEGWHDSDGLRPRSVCAWLVPEDLASPNWQAIGAALADRAFIVPPVPPHRTRVFRYWDPRIAPQMPSIAGATAWAEALRRMGIRQWWTVDDAQGLHRVGADHPGPAAPAEDADISWRLDSRQWQVLQALRWRNHLMQAARAWALRAAPEPALLDHIVRRALALGVTDEADMRSFAHVALSVHARFDEHPEVRRMLGQWDAQGQPAGGFAMGVQAWSDDFFDALARGDWLRPEGEAPQTSARP